MRGMSARATWLGALLSLSVLGAGCSSGEQEDDCASGVRADGVCLTPAKGGSGGGSSGPTGHAPGAPCPDGEVLRCGHAADGTEDTLLLACVDGVYVSRGECPAKGACEATLPGKTSVHCELDGAPLPVALEGTPCAGAAACTLDQAKLLGCKGGTWTAVRVCDAGTSCQRTEAGTSGPGWSCSSAGPCAVCK